MKPPFLLHTATEPELLGRCSVTLADKTTFIINHRPSLCGQLHAPYHWSPRHGPGCYNYLLSYTALELVLNGLYPLDLIPCEKCETQYAKECSTIAPRTKDLSYLLRQNTRGTREEP